MPSLKDMRVRIAATKATQKITKAMQMVAASKLRRAQPSAEAARPYAQQMMKVLGNIAATVVDVCTLFFSRFRSVIAQIPTAQQIIPPVFEGDAGNNNGVVYEYEPDEDEILVELLPRNISVQIFRALLENAASFYGAQMSAMDNATRNAGEMIRKQPLTYNHTRHAMITKDQIEIIPGAEAV